MEGFEYLIFKKVKKLLVVVYPPYGEEYKSDIDISFGFIFSDNPKRVCIITTDKEDMWSPHIKYMNVPQDLYQWKDLKTRTEAWMHCDFDSAPTFEYYDVSNAKIFQNIVLGEIIKIELIGLISDNNPFATKIIFKNDYILSMPISDGNTVETSKFNRHNNLSYFKKIDELEVKYTFIQPQPNPPTTPK